MTSSNLLSDLAIYIFAPGLYTSAEIFKLFGYKLNIHRNIFSWLSLALLINVIFYYIFFRFILSLKKRIGR